MSARRRDLRHISAVLRDELEHDRVFPKPPRDLEDTAPPPPACESCEVNWSVQLGQWVCERCYLEAVAR